MKITPIGRYNQPNIQYKDKINNKRQESFKGAGANIAFDLLDKGFQLLDKNAMIQVAFVDSVATDIPRTIVDLGTSLAAAFETARREFSGLIVNCLIPGVIVKGVAKVLPKDAALKGTDAVNSFANGAAIDRLSNVYKSVQTTPAVDCTRDYVQKSLASLRGLDGTSWVDFADSINKPEFQEAIDKITEAISKKPAERKTLLSEAKSKIVGLTKTESILNFVETSQSNIEEAGSALAGSAKQVLVRTKAEELPHSNLEETIRDIADMGSKFNTVRKNAVENIAENIDEASAKKLINEAVDKYSGSLKKLVNKKSIIGMAIVIAMAVSIQKINRAITRKQFKAEGAPIYKDFGKKQTHKKMTEEEKRAFKAEKAAGAAGMVAMAAASMMKKPTLGMFQFSNIFPTLDQCRWIASSTFASRMLAAEDRNELRESAVRDIASFAGLYFLGDYVKKSVASAFEALSKTQKGAKMLGVDGKVVLLNRKKQIEKPVLEAGASVFKKAANQVWYRLKQFGSWVKDTELKSALEVSGTQTRNLRNICRVADILFSVVMLGVLLPRYNRSVTEKKVAAAKKQEELQRQASMKMLQKDTPAIFKSMLN